MKLKNYQIATLEKIKEFLTDARYVEDLNSVFKKYQDAEGFRAQYKPLKGLEKVPYICVRVPTGGGKTFMAANMIGIASDAYLKVEHPIVLWLVPTDVIRKQTLETLRDKQHPNYLALQDKFGDDIRIFDITEFRQFRTQDMTDNTCVFVATFASLRITNTDGRKVYEYNENFEPHFRNIKDNDYMEKDEAGNIKKSFANALAFLKPLVLVDEAHNNKSQLSVETLSRFRPSAILEFTSTPAPNSNVLYKVSAAELKTEDMIKLPIVLSENLSFEETVAGAIQKRNALEEIAKTDKEYIRPLILFQAEDKNQEYNVEFVKEYLIKEEHIKSEEIAIATGEQKELENVALKDKNCQIRYIITVEALKEGWDCSFAYVLCSAAKTQSSTAAEQFLGRVMRMPYVERRTNPELNKAYAFVTVNNWSEGLANIHDRLVDMGFDKSEAQKDIEFTPPENFQPKTLTIELKEKPKEFEHLFWANEPKIERISTGEFKVKVTIHTPQEARDLHKYATEVIKNTEDSQAICNAVAGIKAAPMMALSKTPSQKGETMSVPQLCLKFEDDEIEAIDENSFCGDGFNLLSTSHELDNFSYNDETKVYEFDLRGELLTEKLLDEDGISAIMNTPWTEEELAVWLNNKVRCIDVSSNVMNKFVLLALDELIETKKIKLETLVRLRYQLANTIEDKIADNRKKVIISNYSQCLFGENSSERLCLAKPLVFSADYPAKSFYSDNFIFQKHFFPNIAEMNPEEIDVAKALDENKKIKYWIRNLERQPNYAFWLQTSTDKFYPDFVAELNDGRILVVEHKGMDRYSDDDSKEKRTLGMLWASLSKGKCLFVMTRLKDAKNRNIKQQIEDVIDGVY